MSGVARVMIVSIVAAIVVFFPSQSEAHEIKKQQCRTYAQMVSVMRNQKKPVYRKADFKKCWKKAKIHLLYHPLPNNLLPPLLIRIRGCESGSGPNDKHGNYLADNSSPSSDASGAYQYLDSTWGGHMGYSRALYAPPRIQDRRAIRDFKSSGTTPWAESSGCWG